MRIHQTLLVKLLFVTVPIFLVLSVLAIWLLSLQDLGLERDSLTARVGNLAARTAGALSRHDIMAEPASVQDLLAALAADRAISCVELKSNKTKSVLNRVPPAQGCAGSDGGQSFEIAVTSDGDITLRIVFKESEITEAIQLRQNISLAAILAAFVIAVFSASVGFQVIIGRRLNGLVSTIRQNTESGRRRIMQDPGVDELGQVISAFNEMLVQEHQREREVARNRALFEAGVANMALGFCVFDADHRLVAFNDEYVRILAFPPGFIEVGMLYEEVMRFRHKRGDIDLRANETVERRFDRVSSETSGAQERNLANGTSHVYQRKLLPGGGFVATFNDITERVQAEEKLRQAQKMEAVGQLTGGVAHDFNNLLAVVRGNAELLRDRGSPDDIPLTQAIIRASERGAELTQRLLAYSRKQPLRSKPINLGDLIHNMGDLLARTLDETIEIETKLGPDLWLALADPGQVENALLNLAINARDAMPRGGKLTIECENTIVDKDYISRNAWAVSGDYVVLSVTDTGIGMSKEVQVRVFEPFFTTKDVGQGSGLGLSMIYGFAKQSGGHVTIDSEEGRGTAVKIFLPRAMEVVAWANVDSDKDLPRGQQEVVLLIEDNIDVQTLVATMLEGLGYRVVMASATIEARSALEREKRVDVILSDIVLPGGVSGLEFAKEIRTQNPDLNVVFMSGYPTGPGKKIGSLSSEDVVLSKPFTREKLAMALWTALH